ncbi:LAGLIDADG family homing endonuclease [Candidatus Nomurabacteria bacterium]|nr:LAGLIDADG family homing endonuclease [Candidatus Nomurabacteria bacterium]
MPIYKEVNKNFFKKWTHTMAYVLGFFSADGYITVNKRGGQFWCIQITDKKLLESIRKTINSNHKISLRRGSNSTKNLYRLQIGSIEMCNDLRQLGLFEKKTKNMVIPQIPKKYLPDFVRGYFDGTEIFGWDLRIRKGIMKPRPCL